MTPSSVTLTGFESERTKACDMVVVGMKSTQCMTTSLPPPSAALSRDSPFSSLLSFSQSFELSACILTSISLHSFLTDTMYTSVTWLIFESISDKSIIGDSLTRTVEAWESNRSCQSRTLGSQSSMAYTLPPSDERRAGSRYITSTSGMGSNLPSPWRIRNIVEPAEGFLLAERAAILCSAHSHNQASRSV